MGQNLLSLTPPTYFHRIKTTQPRWSAPPATNVTVLPSPASAPAEHAGYKYRASGPLCRRRKAINLHEISPRTTPALSSTYTTSVILVERRATSFVLSVQTGRALSRYSQINVSPSLLGLQTW